MGLIFLFTPLSITSLRSVTVGSGRSGGFLFSVCKGKQLYSESNRFLGYWSNKFRKYLCNYLFYREIYRSLPRPLQPPPTPPKGGEEPHPASPKREGSASPSPSERRGCASSQVFCRKLSDKEPSPYPSCAHRHSPPFGGVGGGCRSFSIFTYLSVKQVVTKAFAELVTPVPRKTIVFRIKLLTFANRKEKPHQQPHPTSPEREECRSQDKPQDV